MCMKMIIAIETGSRSRKTSAEGHLLPNTTLENKNLLEGIIKSKIPSQNPTHWVELTNLHLTNSLGNEYTQ